MLLWPPYTCFLFISTWFDQEASSYIFVSITQVPILQHSTVVYSTVQTQYLVHVVFVGILRYKIIGRGVYGGMVSSSNRQVLLLLNCHFAMFLLKKATLPCRRYSKFKHALIMDTHCMDAEREEFYDESRRLCYDSWVVYQ